MHGKGSSREGGTCRIAATAGRCAVQTPLGEVHVCCLEGRPLRIVLGGGCGGETGETPPRTRGCAVLEAVEAFFEGEDCPEKVRSTLLDDPRFTPFQRRVYGVVCSIPRGNTLSYGEVARRAGRAGAARAVGSAMRRNPYPLLIPCHRVIRGDGSPGGYSGPPHAKPCLLALEGMELAPSPRGFLRKNGEA